MALQWRVKYFCRHVQDYVEVEGVIISNLIYISRPPISLSLSPSARSLIIDVIHLCYQREMQGRGFQLLPSYYRHKPGLGFCKVHRVGHYAMIIGEKAN